MRLELVLPLCLVCGCWQRSSEPPLADVPARTATPKRQTDPAGLYTDDEIQKLAKFDIDEESRRVGGLLDIRCLDVVPAGESYPREKVFRELKLNDARVRDFREFGKGRVVFLTWQVSPSYDLSCMTAVNDRDNDGLTMTDPKRKVYGIRLVSRSK
jgi:hypothetical protein